MPQLQIRGRGVAPSWSPDSGQVYFFSLNHSDPETVFDVLDELAGHSQITQPAWDAERRQVVFCWYGRPGSDVWGAVERCLDRLAQRRQRAAAHD